jgi:hypothetical protein
MGLMGRMGQIGQEGEDRAGEDDTLGGGDA